MTRHTSFLPTALAAILIVAGTPGRAEEPATLARQVNELFTNRCAACHKVDGSEEESPHFVGNLGALIDQDYLNRAQPEDSRLYTLLLSGKMPRSTKAEKKEGRKAAPFSGDEAALVLAWIKAGAPSIGGPPPQIVAAQGAGKAMTMAMKTEMEKKPADLKIDEPAKPTAGAGRKVVTDAEVFAGALQDLLSLPPEDQRDTRYLSFAPLHNNLEEVTDADLELAGQGLTKLLNSLSYHPKVLTFPAAGSEGVLRRVRLRDFGWTAGSWERVTATFPYLLNSAGLTALSGLAKCAVPVVRADWFAAVASRPPFYDAILGLPRNARELEHKLGIDVAKNLAAGEAVRSGFTQSGISKQNRLVERHEIKSYPGAYWKSYDFRENVGRGRLHEFPLGPRSAGLFRSAHAFEHAGGEIIFNLPNGFQAYLLTNQEDVRLDEAAPTDIVSDRLDKTRRAAISNGLSCIACHDEGMKTLPADELRATAGSARFGAEAARLITRLHSEQPEIERVLQADQERYQAALRLAGLPAKSVKEPVIALIDLFERDVTLAQAAAEMGLAKADFDAKLEASGGALFDEKIALRGAGIPRVAFADPFTRMALRLGLGDPREFDAAPTAFTAVTDPHRLSLPAAGSAPLAVELQTDRRTYRGGDHMLVTVRTSEDAWLRLIYQDAQNNVSVLLPNGKNDGRIRGGVPVVFGTEASGFRLRVGPPWGEEILAAVVSNTPFADDAEVRRIAAHARGGLASGRSKAKTRGVEVEIVETVRQRTRDGRLGVARVKVRTAP